MKIFLLRLYDFLLTFFLSLFLLINKIRILFLKQRIFSFLKHGKLRFLIKWPFLFFSILTQILSTMIIDIVLFVSLKINILDNSILLLILTIHFLLNRWFPLTALKLGLLLRLLNFNPLFLYLFPFLNPLSLLSLLSLPFLPPLPLNLLIIMSNHLIINRFEFNFLIHSLFVWWCVSVDYVGEVGY